MTKEYDLVVLGGGTGGYVAAIRASQLGMSVALVESNKIGGTCLHDGCIPSKSLLKSAEVFQTLTNALEYGIDIEVTNIDFSKVQQRKEKVVNQLFTGVKSLIAKNKIDVYQGFGRILGPSIFSPLPGTISIEHLNGQENTMIVPKNVLISTGSIPRELKELPFDNKLILSSTDALNLEDLPKNVCIIGGGAIGVEWASLLVDLNVEVTIIENNDRLLANADKDISIEIKKALEKRGVEIFTNSEFQAEILSDRVEITTSKTKKVFEKVIVSIGREANIKDIGLNNTSITVESNLIITNENYQTNESHIYAIGDCIGGLQLAHVASAEGRKAVEHMNNIETDKIDNTSIPICTYSNPEIAQVGLTEKQVLDKGIPYKVGKFPFSSIGKAVIENKTEGFVKIIVNSDTNDLLGVHMIGADSTNMIAEASLAKILDATHWEIHETVHPHPSLSEVFFEAALSVDNLEIHN